MIVDGKTKSLEESVYHALREEILDGRLQAGEAITECALAGRLGVSRTPIRGAFHRLFEEGLIRITPNRGAVVVGVDTDDLVGIYKIRVRLEGLASREAALKISEEEKRQLSESVELSEFYIQKKDTEHLKELDTEFHRIIYKASGNRLLYKTLSELHGNITAYRKLSLTVGDRLERSVKEHRDMLTAIENKDASLAESLAEKHVRAALDNLLSVLKKD